MAGDGSAPGAGSPTARLAFLVAVCLLVYGSFFPATEWSDPGVSPFAWLRAPFPRYWTFPEIAWNVLAYLPVGLLLAWSLRPAVRGVAAVVVSTLVCAAMSASVESIQTYLPGRVASNVDFVANSMGAFIGAVAGVLTARRIIDAAWEVHWGRRMLRPGTHAAVVLAGLWILAQIPAQPMLFGTGDIVGLLPEAAFRPEAWWPGVAGMDPVWRVRAEQVCTAFAVIGVAMLLMHCLRPVPLRALLMPLLVIVALSVKAAAQPLAPPGGPDVFAWLTPGAWGGLLAGLVAATVLTAAPAVWQRRVAILTLLGQLLIVNLFPIDRYFQASVATGYTGLLYLDALLREIAVLWPLAALGWLAMGKGSRDAAGRQHPASP